MKRGERLKNKKSQGLLIFALIIAIICIIVLGYFVYTLTKSNADNNNEINQLRTESEGLKTTINTIQDALSNINVNGNTSNNTNKSDETTSNSNISDTDKEKIEEVARAFINAVNEKDWNTVQKYSNSDVVSALQQYNVSNMSIDYSTLAQNPNNSNSYYYTVSYDIDYNDLDIKDVGLGKLFCLNKSNNTFVVTSFGVTGL